jgi:hypothetical protein
MFLLAASTVSTVGLGLLDFLLPTISAILTALAIVGVKAALDKVGIARSKEIDEMVDKYVKVGVNYAQRYAEKKLDGRDLTPEDKLGIAVKTVLGELEQSKIKNVAHDLIVGRVEAALQTGDVRTKKLA